MKKIFPIILLFPLFTAAQNTFTAIVKNDNTKEPLKGATVRVKGLQIGGTTNDSGIILLQNIPTGKFVVEISNVGYQDAKTSYHFPLNGPDTIPIFLEPEARELAEIRISSTRTGRSIRNTPSRIEVIAADEIHEEATMRPTDIKMLLSESTGIQTQQTSATTGNASIRIQGLDGRYTQILKDGFPLYSGAANGLGLLQIPPLDLQQVEIVKGASSTLYGGGAIAGLINLISKVPHDQRELHFNINVTSAGGLDANTFYSQKFKKTGVTIFASRNTNKPYAPGNTIFTAIPRFDRYTFNPKLFLYLSDKTKLSFGINSSFENRLGGDIHYIRGKGDSIHRYFENNKTQRVSTELTFDHELKKGSNIEIKNSVSYFNRSITSNKYRFAGTQYSTFSEATYRSKKEKRDWVAGLNILTDRFKEDALSSPVLRDYLQTTLGGFVQNTWDVANWLTLETGLRGDYVKDYGFALLPHASALFKIAPGLTTRLGGGFGYKAPTIFTEESERLLYKNVLPVNSQSNSLERSYGGNWDVNYNKSFDKINLSINQFFFYTYLNHPLLLDTTDSNTYKFKNIAGNLHSKGSETNVRLNYNDFTLYLGYTYTDARLFNNGVTVQNPLTPKYRFNAALVYEIEDKLRIGSELYHFSSQPLSDGSNGRPYWLYGLVAEKEWKHLSLYINFEDIGNVRQTKFDSIFTGSVSSPVFKDIYAPLEGFTMNGGIILKLDGEDK